MESEAAGIFYFSDLNTQVDSEQEEEELNNPFIICDIGGGTVDICTFKKDTKKDGLIEEYPPMGGDYGGNYINKEFMKRLIIELFGEKRLEKAKNDEKYIEFEKNIETLKIISDEAIEDIKRNKGENIEKDKIKWVVAIPSFLTEKSKEIMLNA